MLQANTSYLEVVIHDSENIKLIIYMDSLIPNWESKQMVRSCLSVKPSEFTFDYVKKMVSEVYRKFPDKEIHELLTKTEEVNIYV